MSVEKGKIYKITNKINGLVYVGCTINSLEKRFYEHLYRCFKTDYQSKLYNSIKKNGEENFVIELIEECDLCVIYETEKKYIEEFNTYHNGLNSTFGGEGTLGYKHSSEIKRKISVNTKNGNSHKGKTYEELYGGSADEQKQKRRLSVKSRWEELNKEEKDSRSLNIKTSLQKKSKYGIDLVKEIKEQINNGLKVKEFKQNYPQVRVGFFYELKNGKSWTNIK